LGTPRYPVASIVVLQPFAVLSFKRHQSIDPREAPPHTAKAEFCRRPARKADRKFHLPFYWFE